MLKFKETRSYRQIYAENWLKLRELIHKDEKLKFKPACKDMLLLLQEQTNYRTGEVNINIPMIINYLDCSRATAYAVLKWFKDNGILIMRDESGSVPAQVDKCDAVYYGK